MGASVACLPLASDLPSLVCMLLPLAMASSALTSTPTALVADLVDGGQRSQALSLLRTAGDAGERACYAPESVVWCAVVWSCLFFFCIRD